MDDLKLDSPGSNADDKTALYARSSGQSVQDVIADDKIAGHPCYAQTSYNFLGDDDIPIDRYISREWHDLEVKHIWYKTWQVACRVEEIASPGDYVVYDIIKKSVIVCRTSSGEVKAYVNACLHRGTTLCEGVGKVGAFRCPYHGFTWSLEGKLKWVPGKWDFPHIDRIGNSLPEVRVGVWGGFVFVNLDPDCGSLEEYLEVLPRHIDEKEMEGRYKAAHVSQIVDCNWKVLQEAFIEGFHVAETHYQKDEQGTILPDELFSPVTHDTATQYDIWPGVKHINRLLLVGGVPSEHVAHRIKDEQQIADAYARLHGIPKKLEVRPGERARDVIADYNRVALGEMYHVDLSNASTIDVMDQIQYNIFPNYTIWPTIVAPLLYRFRPFGDDHEKSIFEVFYLFPKPTDGSAYQVATELRLEQGQKWAEVEALGMYGPIIDDDIPNLSRIQRGLGTTLRSGAMLANYQEVRIRHFHKTLEQYIDEGEAQVGA